MSAIFLYFWLESSVGVVKTELYVPMNFFSRNTQFWKNIYYQNHFRFLDGNFPGLRQKNSGRFSILHSICQEKVFERSICWKHTLAHCFFRFLRFFLWIYADFCWQCCQNWTLRFHRIVFLWSLLFEKKAF